ncbi:Adenine phosphoribosyltransferase (EC 2.4.2.7) [Sideroxydans sp. CL21]|nr:Adenine phosphoribosyltransferase (EC 2.4.2.7) [Sideroxydans sp. CL21]
MWCAQNVSGYAALTRPTKLPDIGGRARLEKWGHKVFALCEFEGD